MKHCAAFAGLALGAAMLWAPASAQSTGLENWPENRKVAGVGLGDNYEKLFETFDKSKSIIETHGYSKKHGVETSTRIWFYKEGAQEEPVDVIEKYDFQIRDGQVYITGEADGEGRIFFLMFRQTAEGSGSARLAQMTQRYGRYDKDISGTYQWGCETPQSPCLEGEPSDYRMQVTMSNYGHKNAWNSKFRTMMSAAKGESTADRF